MNNMMKPFSLVFLALLLTQVVGAAGPALPTLGVAGNFTALAETPTLSTTGGGTILGNIGISPCASTCITGFALAEDPSDNFATSFLVTGKVYAPDYTGVPAFTGPTPSMMTTAINNMFTAYTTAAGITAPAPVVNIGAGNLAGLTLVPGVYKFSTDVTIPSPGVTLDCQGNSSSTYIFQISGALDLGPGSSINLIGNCQPQNIYWQVQTQATIETTAAAQGIFLAGTAIVMQTGSTLTGRALAQSEITLSAATLTAPPAVQQLPTTTTTIPQTTTSILPAGGPGSGGSYGSGGGFGSVRPTVTPIPNGWIVSNVTEIGTFNVTLCGQYFRVRENFITPTYAGVSITLGPATSGAVNLGKYVLYPGLPLQLVGFPTCYVELLGTQYTPLQHTIVLTFYNVPPVAPIQVLPPVNATNTTSAPQVNMATTTVAPLAIIPSSLSMAQIELIVGGAIVLILLAWMLYRSGGSSPGSSSRKSSG